VRYGLIGSVLFHVVVGGLIIFSFLGNQKTPLPPPAVPVSIETMTPKEYSDRQAGATDSTAQKPAPAAEVKAPEAPATAKKEVEEKPAPKPAQTEAMAPPPAPAETPPAPKPAEVPPPKPAEEAKVEKAPDKAVEKPAPKAVDKAAAERKALAKAKAEEAKKAAEAEARRARAKKLAERPFNPDQIETLLRKDTAAPRDEAAPPPSQAAMDVPPSKTSSDKPTALINRDPDAGEKAGDYEPGKPWRPASSLEDQAMGMHDAHGRENANSDADLLISQIARNWDLPPGQVGGDTEVITLHFRLRPDGMLAADPEVLNGSSDPAFAAAADAAKRAVLRAQPLRFPPDRYGEFRDNTISFDPRDMYRGNG
jgi:colicin import membrane protein